MHSIPKTISSVLNRNLVFVHGKGGVGKTAVSRAISMCLAQNTPNKKVLWVTLEDPTFPAGKRVHSGSNLWHLNCDFTDCFAEYASLKIGASHLTRIFLKNALIRYLAQAAPGVRDLVLLGKIWFEGNEYSHVVVDMPSTGYGLALFQSTENFSKLFRGGPLHRDAESMLETFRDAHKTGHLIVALPEEMPLRESLELNQYLTQLFPENPAAFLINRVFPVAHSTQLDFSSHPKAWDTPLAKSAEDYVLKRAQLEHHNMKIWKDEGISFGELEYVPPPLTEDPHALLRFLAEQIKTKAYV
jgi:hypothetical protein